MVESETDARSGSNDSWKREYFIKRFVEERSNSKVLYVHTPFCKSKCRYCVYSSRVPKNNDELEAFVDVILPQQVYQYIKIFENVTFDEVYFGGGTPTILSPKQLNQIFDMIPDFGKIPNKCIEASPNTLTLEHIELLARKKFSFLSLGIQSLDEKLLKRYGRPSLSKEELISMCGKIRDVNLFFNLDLICYLDKGDIRDLPKFENELKYVLEYLKPNSVTIHQCYQSIFTIEKTKYLLEVIYRILGLFEEYTLANSRMDITQEELTIDTVKQAEYRLVRKAENEYRHYMWDKLASLPVEGYDILSIGYIPKCHTTSNVKKMVYEAAYGTLVFST